MNCHLHPNNEAVGSCTSCGKPICQECAVEVQNKFVCRECLSNGKTTIPQYSVNGKPPKDRSIALILEILVGLFGFLGFGWIYAGETNRGVITLAGFFAWHILIVLPLALITASAGLCLTIPIDIIIIGFSSFSLNNYLQQHPERFG
jgi:hypothetical protein